MSIILFTEEDFAEAKKLKEKELVKPFNKTNVFRAGVYAILTARETYKNLIKYCHYIVHKDQIGFPEKLAEINDLQKYESLRMIPSNHVQRVLKFAKWWVEYEPFKLIKEQKKGNLEDQVYLRNILASNKKIGDQESAAGAPGMRHKISSLFLNMCGYEQIVSVDVWLMRWLNDNHLAEIDADKITRRGLDGSKYLKLEEKIQEKAKEWEITPANLHNLIWCKNSNWNQNNGAQIELFPEEALPSIYEQE
jgi:thermostable 8-oxoguanine DNA glycosylase